MTMIRIGEKNAFNTDSTLFFFVAPGRNSFVRPTHVSIRTNEKTNEIVCYTRPEVSSSFPYYSIGTLVKL